MYFKSIKISNYGPISNANIDFRFDSSGKPLPIVLIGRNGTGKSLFITNLVDALIETKRHAFPLGILEVNNNSFYKVGKKLTLKMVLIIQ